VYVIRHLNIDSLCEYDPVASFSKDLPEDKRELIILPDGEPLRASSALWCLGMEAYEYIKEEVGRPLTAEEFDKNKALLDDHSFKMIKEIIELNEKNKLFLVFDDPAFNFREWLDNADWIERMEFIVDNSALFKADDNTSIFDATDKMVCSFIALYELNESVYVSKISHDKDWFASNVLRVKEWLVRGEQRSIKRKAISKAASKAASVRHKENHALKKDAQYFYLQNKESFPSMSAVAEKLSKDILPITFRTAYKWVREANKKD